MNQKEFREAEKAKSDAEFQAKLEKIRFLSEKRIAASAAAKAKKAAEEPVVIQPDIEEPRPIYQLQLPFHGDARAYLRSVPNSVLRSALFGAIRRGRRAFQQGVKKASVDGVLVIHTGPTLDQSDLDVWLQCLELARIEGVGMRIRFTCTSFLKAIDRSTGGKDVEWLKNAFRRLSSSVVEIQDGKKVYFGPMLIGGARDDETGQYAIEMNPPIVQLFGDNSWTGIDQNARRSLKKQPLAQWLHGFYLSHANPFPYKIETIHRLCGSENKQLKSFKRELNEALSRLAWTTGWTCQIDDNNLLHIIKSAKNITLSQQKNVLKNMKRQPASNLR